MGAARTPRPQRPSFLVPQPPELTGEELLVHEIVVTAVGLALILLLLSAPLTATEPLILDIAQRDKINPGLGPPPEELDRSTPAATWKSFLSLGAGGSFSAAAHCLDLTEIPEDRQFEAGLTTAERLYRVLKVLGARPGAVTSASPEGPEVGGKPTNHLIPNRFERRGIKGEVWLLGLMLSVNLAELAILIYLMSRLLEGEVLLVGVGLSTRLKKLRMRMRPDLD